MRGPLPTRLTLLAVAHCTLADRELAAGRHGLVWDGRDDGGRRVPAGSYRYRLELPGGEGMTQGMVVVR